MEIVIKILAFAFGVFCIIALLSYGAIIVGGIGSSLRSGWQNIKAGFKS